MPTVKSTSPNFKIKGKTKATARVFLHCSNLDCDKLLREIKPTEEILVTRAYFCEECDDGVIVMNPPRKDEV